MRLGRHASARALETCTRVTPRSSSARTRMSPAGESTAVSWPRALPICIRAPPGGCSAGASTNRRVAGSSGRGSPAPDGATRSGERAATGGGPGEGPRGSIASAWALHPATSARTKPGRRIPKARRRSRPGVERRQAATRVRFDLEAARGQPPEVGEGARPGAEVLQPHPDPELGQPFHQGPHRPRMLGHGVLTDLERLATRRAPCSSRARPTPTTSRACSASSARASPCSKSPQPSRPSRSAVGLGLRLRAGLTHREQGQRGWVAPPRA